jgi:hypothetical protein
MYSRVPPAVMRKHLFLATDFISYQKANSK